MQTRACPHCGAQVPVGDRFCGECGKPVDSEPLAQAPQAPPVKPAIPPAYSAPPPAVYAPPAGMPGAVPAPRKGGLPVPLLIGGGLLLCVIVACIAVIASGALTDIFSSPTAEPDATPVAGVTSLPVKTPSGTRSLPGPTEPPATQPPSPAGAVLFEDDFSDPLAGKWGTSSDENAGRAVVDGHLEIDVYTPQWAAWSTNGKTAGDAVYMVDVQWLGGPSQYDGGLVLRERSGDFYALLIDTLGRYSFFLVQGDEWIPVVDWTDSDAVRIGEGASNHLVVTANGDAFILEINGQTLDTASEPTLQRGEYGMIATSYDEANSKVGFDNFVVRKLITP